MNKAIRILLLLVCVILTTGCSTYEKITVYGTPGKKIYSPAKDHIATISDKGKAEIEIPSSVYYAYLFTRDDTDKTWIPFGLDVCKKSHNGTKMAAGAGYTLTGIGLTGLVTSIVVLTSASKDDDSMTDLGAYIAGGGAALGGIGALIGVPASERLKQLSYQYNFGYLKTQQSNDDMKFTDYVPPTEEKRKTEPATTRTKATGGSNTASSTETSVVKSRKHTVSSKAKRRKTVAETIAGEYSGSGSLVALSGGYKEALGKIVIKITPEENNNAYVEIFEDGEAFFDNEELFTVKRNSDGSVSLTHVKIPSVKFVIYKTGKFDYIHPRVNIDDITYTLTIKGEKTPQQ